MARRKAQQANRRIPYRANPPPRPSGDPDAPWAFCVAAYAMLGAAVFNGQASVLLGLLARTLTCALAWSYQLATTVITLLSNPVDTAARAVFALDATPHFGALWHPGDIPGADDPYYVGWIVGQNPHGHGTVTSDVVSFQGDFVDGVPEGSNMHVEYGTGAVYDGAMAGGEHHGYGTMVHEWGDVYTGLFRHGDYWLGTQEYTSGKTHFGFWHNFEPDGWGVETLTSGAVREGVWGQGLDALLTTHFPPRVYEWPEGEVVRAAHASLVNAQRPLSLALFRVVGRAALESLRDYDAAHNDGTRC